MTEFIAAWIVLVLALVFGIAPFMYRCSDKNDPSKTYIQACFIGMATLSFYILVLVGFLLVLGIFSWAINVAFAI